MIADAGERVDGQGRIVKLIPRPIVHSAAWEAGAGLEARVFTPFPRPAAMPFARNNLFHAQRTVELSLSSSAFVAGGSLPADGGVPARAEGGDLVRQLAAEPGTGDGDGIPAAHVIKSVEMGTGRRFPCRNSILRQKVFRIHDNAVLQKKTPIACITHDFYSETFNTPALHPMFYIISNILQIHIFTSYRPEYHTLAEKPCSHLKGDLLLRFLTFQLTGEVLNRFNILRACFTRDVKDKSHASNRRRFIHDHFFTGKSRKSQYNHSHQRPIGEIEFVHRHCF